MKNIFHIITLVLCLGIFVFPKQSFAMVNMQECCTEMASKHDCCTDKNNQHQKSTTSDDCHQTGCCNVCHTYTSTVFCSDFLNHQNSENNFYFHKKAVYQYQQPSLSSFLKEIWQPPKIA